jgi:hypothetical protein
VHTLSCSRKHVRPHIQASASPTSTSLSRGCQIHLPQLWVATEDIDCSLLWSAGTETLPCLQRSVLRRRWREVALMVLRRLGTHLRARATDAAPASCGAFVCRRRVRTVRMAGASQQSRTHQTPQYRSLAVRRCYSRRRSVDLRFGCSSHLVCVARCGLTPRSSRLAPAGSVSPG